MNEATLLGAIDETRGARQAEQKAAELLADARAGLEKIRAITLASAYQEKRISGGNEQARKVQEAEALAASEPVQKAEAALRLAESQHVAARIERLYREERYSALLVLTGTSGDSASDYEPKHDFPN